MAWWLWVLAGIALLAVEVATPGSLFALFFGVGAFGVAVFAALGASPAIQWFAFSILSLLGVGLLRGPLVRRWSRKPPRPGELIGERATLLEDLPPRGEARAELRGTIWMARSAAAASLEKGQRCVVERTEGLTLWVRPESSTPNGGDEA